MSEKYWSYRPATPTPEKSPEQLNFTKEEWEQLSPGMRREIEKQFRKSNL